MQRSHRAIKMLVNFNVPIRLSRGTTLNLTSSWVTRILSIVIYVVPIFLKVEAAQYERLRDTLN